MFRSIKTVWRCRIAGFGYLFWSLS